MWAWGRRSCTGAHSCQRALGSTLKSRTFCCVSVTSRVFKNDVTDDAKFIFVTNTMNKTQMQMMTKKPFALSMLHRQTLVQWLPSLSETM